MTELFEQKNLQPLYIQVAVKLKCEIDKGTFPAGSKLPSENQLVDLLKVSRVTVRKALQQLNDGGYIFSEKGKGSFVKSNKLRHDFLSMSGLAQEIAGAGLETTNIIDAFKVLPADEFISKKLNISLGDPVNFARRLRLVDDKVASFEEFYIPRVLLPQLNENDLKGSKFEYLSRHGIEMVKTQQKLLPTLPDAAVQRLLDVDELEPILINESQNFYEEYKIYEYSIVYYKSSMYDFEITARV